MPPLRPVRKRYTQCSGDDSSPSSPAEGLAPVGCYGNGMSNERPYGQVAAGCRRYIRYVNGIRNVAAMIPRQPAPARGWPRWMFGIRTSNEWPYGRVAAGCRRYVRYVQRYAQCSGDDSSPASPAEGLAPLDVWNTNIQRVALRPGGGRLPPLHPVRTMVYAM